MKKLKILLFMPMLFALVACSDDSVTTAGDEFVPVFNVIGIEFVDDNITIDKLSGANSGAFVTPNYISDQRLTFVSADPNIAIGDNETGAIIGLSEGTTTIRVSSATYAGASNVMTVNVTATEGNGYFVANNGTWLIMNRNGMEKFRDNVTIDGNYQVDARLMADIMLDNTTSWAPIVDRDIINDVPGYSGTFDGNNKTISGLFINQPINSDNSNGDFGMFSKIGDIGIVKNLNINSPVVNGGSRIGVLASVSYGRIENVTITNPTVSSYREAGVVLTTNNGILRNTHVVGGSVDSVEYFVGGIASTNNSSGVIEFCSNSATVTGTSTDRAGGIAASNSGLIRGSYNTGDVTAPARVGGIVGAFIFGSSGTNIITSSYNIGNVTATTDGADAGALFGSGITSNVDLTYNTLYYLKNSVVNSAISGGINLADEIGKVEPVGNISDLNSPIVIEALNNGLGTGREYEFKAGSGNEPPYIVKVNN